MDGTEEDPNQIAHFDLGSNCPAGGITKVNEVNKTEGKGGNVLYLYVSDLEAMEKVSNVTIVFSWAVKAVSAVRLYQVPGANNCAAENPQCRRQEGNRHYSRR